MTSHRKEFQIVLVRVRGRVMTLFTIGAAFLAQPAIAQDPPILTLTVASVPGPTEIGESVEVPILSLADDVLPAIVFFFMEFDESKITFVDLRLGDGVPEGKQASSNIIRSDTSTIATLAMGLFGLDTNSVPNGPIFVVTFDIAAALPGETILLPAVDASAVSPDGTSFDVFLEDGVIDLTCPFVPAPQNVSASDGDSDGIEVTWNAVAGVSGYRLYRSAENNPDAASPIAEWQAATSFLDLTAPAPRLITRAGCNPRTDIVNTTLYYFIKARVREDCESMLSAGDAGFRGGDPAKALDEISQYDGEPFFGAGNVARAGWPLPVQSPLDSAAPFAAVLLLCAAAGYRRRGRAV